MATSKQAAESEEQEDEELTRVGKPGSGTDSADTNATALFNSNTPVAPENLKNCAVVTTPECDTSKTVTAASASVTSVVTSSTYAIPCTASQLSQFASIEAASLPQRDAGRAAVSHKHKSGRGRDSPEGAAVENGPAESADSFHKASASTLGVPQTNVPFENEPAEVRDSAASARPHRALQARASIATDISATEFSAQKSSPSDVTATADHRRALASSRTEPGVIATVQQSVDRLRNNCISRTVRTNQHPLERELGCRVTDDNGAVSLADANKARRWISSCLSCRENPKEVCVQPCQHWTIYRDCFLSPDLGSFTRCFLCGGNVESVRFTVELQKYLQDRSV